MLCGECSESTRTRPTAAKRRPAKERLRQRVRARRARPPLERTPTAESWRRARRSVPRGEVLGQEVADRLLRPDGREGMVGSIEIDAPEAGRALESPHLGGGVNVDVGHARVAPADD